MIASDIHHVIVKLTDPEPSVASRAKQMLIELGRAAVLPLADALPGSSDRTCWIILQILTTIGDQRAVPAVASCLNSEHRAIQGLAAQCLGSLGDPKAVPALLRALAENPTSSTTGWIIQALGQLQDARALKVLLKIVEETESAAIRYTAIDALSMLGDPSALQTIVKYENSDNAHVRDHARIAIERLTAIAETRIQR